MALWYARYRQVLPDLYRHQVLSHRDLDQKNVLWPDAETPLLIDWESAGMINPTVELADVALNWSGVTVGEPDPAAFAAVVAAYRDHGGRLTDEPRDALYAVLVNWLAWLRYAASQVITLHGAVAELRRRTELDPVGRRLVQAATAQHTGEIARFDRETVNTLATVSRIAANLDLYASWLSS
jgi:thiamine kinase-like enzyme